MFSQITLLHFVALLADLILKLANLVMRMSSCFHCLSKVSLLVSSQTQKAVGAGDRAAVRALGLAVESLVEASEVIALAAAVYLDVGGGLCLYRLLLVLRRRVLWLAAKGLVNAREANGAVLLELLDDFAKA